MPRAGSESPILDSRGPGGWGTTNTRGERAALRGDLTQARDTSATRQARAAPSFAYSFAFQQFELWSVDFMVCILHACVF
jgi:hypothetical protein